VLLKCEPVLGDFDPSRYETEYRWCRAGRRAYPVALVYRRDLFRRDGTRRCCSTATAPTAFLRIRVFVEPVVAAGPRFVYAIAQVRGGRSVAGAGTRRAAAREEAFVRGFHRSTRWLVAEGYADAKRVFARAAVPVACCRRGCNMAPELYRGIVAHVPFVDIVTRCSTRAFR